MPFDHDHRVDRLESRMSVQHFFRKIALQRSEHHRAPFVVLEDMLDGLIAEPAETIKKKHKLR
jgi:hypothetical protein